MSLDNFNLLDDLEQIRRREEKTLAAIETISFDNITERLRAIQENSLENVRVLEVIAEQSRGKESK